MEILRVEHLARIYGKGETEVRALDGTVTLADALGQMQKKR